MKKNLWLLTLFLALLLSITACSSSKQEAKEVMQIVTDKPTEQKTEESAKEPEVIVGESTGEAIKETNESHKAEEKLEPEQTDVFGGYTIIEVDGGDLSGYRESNVAVDVGFGARKYWAFTNEHGQLVKVIADEIILQDDNTEPVNAKGRYYNDEAKVPGTESPALDEGHVIADSLGGVSNAYNITPQNSTLNRHGDQAYMEKVIRDAGGCTDFEAIITYPDIKTQIPSKYEYTYTLKGSVIVDEFENVNPDEYNEATGLTKAETPEKKKSMI